MEISTWWFVPLSALAVLPWLLAAAARRPRLLLALTAAAWVVLSLVPLRYAFFRFLTVCALLIPSVRTLLIIAGRDRPTTYVEALHLFSIPAVIRFDTPRQPDTRLALCILLTSVAHLVLIVALWVTLTQFNHPVLIIIGAQVGCYLMLSVMTGVPRALLTFRGIDHDPPFRRPFLAATPAEFWGYRWNTWVNHLLHYYVFLPAGGRRNSARGTIAAFAVSGLIHEAIVGISAYRFTGLMLLYFLIQGVLVIVTSRSRWFRGLARRYPTVSRAVTAVLLLASGILIVGGALPLMRVR